MEMVNKLFRLKVFCFCCFFSQVVTEEIDGTITSIESKSCA